MQDGGGQDGDVGRVQSAVEVIQKQMRAHDGSFLQFRCDEKGFLSICAFGLPGRTRENGASRAVLAALAIVAVLKETGQVRILYFQPAALSQAWLQACGLRC